MTFLSVLREQNRTRMKRWHGAGPEWSVVDWSNAAAGEMGEVCNAVKKLRRIEGGFASKNAPERQINTREQAIATIAEEIGDTIVYLDLLADHLGINLTTAIAETFNRVSEKYNFPERL